MNACLAGNVAPANRDRVAEHCPTDLWWGYPSWEGAWAKILACHEGVSSQVTAGALIEHRSRCEACDWPVPSPRVRAHAQRGPCDERWWCPRCERDRFSHWSWRYELCPAIWCPGCDVGIAYGMPGGYWCRLRGGSMSQIRTERQAWYKYCPYGALYAMTDWPGPTHVRQNSLMRMQYLFYGVGQVCIDQRSSVNCQGSRTGRHIQHVDRLELKHWTLVFGHETFSPIDLDAEENHRGEWETSPTLEAGSAISSA